jgi:hypothetical protein
MAKQKEPNEMNLGELVEALVVETVNYATGQWTSDSPYTSKEEYNKESRESYIKRTNALREELNEREQLYETK